MGKSTLAKFVTRQFHRYLVWDMGLAWEWGTKDWNAVQPNYQRFGRVVYQPSTGMSEAQLVDRFRDFCRFALSLSSTAVLIDEPRRRLLETAEFDNFHRMGHKRNNFTIICPHSLWDLPHVSQQFDHLFIFRVTRAVDQNVLVQVAPREAAEWAKTAPPYHFWYHTPMGGGPHLPVPKT